MARPIKLRSDNNLQIMTGPEMAYIANRVLTQFAATNTVSINPSDTTGLTNIGTFADDIRDEALGTHPATGAITTTNYIFYQDRQAQSENHIHPIEFSSSHLREQNDSQLNNSIISYCLNTLVASGVGSYKLQPNAPSGGTWTERGTIQDTLRGGSTSTSKLWQKTADTVPTKVVPLKLRSDNHLQEMTEAEIQNLVGRLRNRINATGIGRYQLQANAPTGGGTWVQMGSGFTDTRRQVNAVNYSGTYTNNFSGTYTQNFAGTYTGYYARYAPWSGAYQGNYAGSYTGYYTGYFTGTYTGYFTGTYSGQTVQSSTEDGSGGTVKLWVRTA